MTSQSRLHVTEAIRREREDYRWLMTEAAGRRIVFRLLSEAGVFRGSYTSGQTEDTFFREGQRAIGLSLLNRVMEESPDAFMLMLKEQKEQNDG